MGFNKRLEKFLNLYKLSASTLAEKIDINRSTISHLLSGRNKPSLDLIMKLHEHFPKIDLEWWLYGEGNLDAQKDGKNKKPGLLQKNQSESPDLKTEPIKNFKSLPPSESDKTRKIKRILILYEDGSFDDYRN